MRDPKDKAAAEEIAENSENAEQGDSGEEEEIGFPDFITNLK